MQEKIKEIIVKILYLDSPDEITNDASLFVDYNFSSIDYIDLCFELKRVFSMEFNQKDLWPIDSMEQDEKYYHNDQWTPSGWKVICDTLNLTVKEPLSKSELYQYFSVNYIQNRLGVLAS